MLDQLAQKLYIQRRYRGYWNRLRSRVTRRSNRLFNLAKIEALYTVSARYSGGVQTVPISHIQGTENRGNDFDRDFNPLNDHNEQRWRNMAALWMQGQEFPLIELVQVGQIYFVRDGHHRISVARALGQEVVDAQVTVLQINEPLFWERTKKNSKADGRRPWYRLLRPKQWLTALTGELKKLLHVDWAKR